MLNALYFWIRKIGVLASAINGAGGRVARMIWHVACLIFMMNVVLT